MVSDKAARGQVLLFMLAYPLPILIPPNFPHQLLIIDTMEPP
jgi:hypothetical protein